MRALIQSFFRSRPTATRSFAFNSQYRLRSWQNQMRPSTRTLTTSPARRQNEEVADRRLQMTFTCTAGGCGHRSVHEFSHHAYTKGIVLVTCPQCKNRHLIADHVGWFKESTEEGKLRTVEDLLKARGEQVKRGRVGSDGVIEYYGEETRE